MASHPHEQTRLTRQRALRFVILMGMISLFADMTYEGARSITGPYLALLGASGTIVGIVSGLGEFIGYTIRLISGYISDRTRSYWAVTFIGFFLNLLTVPLLALTNQWPIAATLIILERLGRAIRSPPRDAMLSYATHATGRGWGFGLHEALDQIGAITGPLSVAAILYFRNSYSLGFAILLFPALLTLALLGLAYRLYPRPEELEVSQESIKVEGFNRNYWLYAIAICLVAAGFVDFPLIAYHFEQDKVIPAIWIPFLYALAMAVDGLSALLLGKWFDRQGMIVLIFATFCSALSAPFAFWGDFRGAVISMILWGIGMGAQESLVRAVVSQLVGKQKRATAFGLLHFWFGIFWLIGSALMGYLYDHFLAALIYFSVGMQLASLPFFWMLKGKKKILIQ
jgi:MFS family permease